MRDTTCKKYGLKATGKKEELRERLLKSDLKKNFNPKKISSKKSGNDDSLNFSHDEFSYYFSQIGSSISEIMSGFDLPGDIL